MINKRMLLQALSAVLVLLSLTVVGNVFAQQEQPQQQQEQFTQMNWPVVCSQNHASMASFLAKYGEKPLIRGDVVGETGVRARMTVIVNEQTRSWSVIVHNSRGICLITSGENFAWITTQQADSSASSPSTNR